MAIAFGAAIGEAHDSLGWVFSHGFNTTTTVPAGAKIIVSVAWYDPAVISSVTGGGLTWTVDKNVIGVGSASYRCAICSADAPSGLASGTTITVNYDTGITDTRTQGLSGFYITGAATGAPDSTGGVGYTTAGTSASSTVTTVRDETLIAQIVYVNFLDVNTITPVAGMTEVYDVRHDDAGWRFETAYRIVTANGTYSIGGTWTGSNEWLVAGVAYKAAPRALDFGAAIGEVHTPGLATTHSFNTTTAVPAGGRIIVATSYYATGTVTFSGGSLTWTTDKTEILAADTHFRVAIGSANAPSGLASGTTITATYSVSAEATTVTGVYIIGAATTSAVDATAGASNASAGTDTGTTTLTTTNANDIIIQAVQLYTVAPATDIVPASGMSEVYDLTNTDGPIHEMAYRVVTSTGGYTVGGSWPAGGAGRQYVVAGVAYKAATTTVNSGFFQLMRPSAAAPLMAVRFDGSTDKYSRSATGLGGNSVAWTRCCWVKIAVDRNTYSMVLGADNAGSGYNSLGLMANGTQLGCIRNTGDGNAVGADLTVGIWYFIADTHPAGSATTGTWYWQTEGQSTLNSVNSAANATNPLADAWTFYIGNDGFNSFLNGSVAQVRVWTAALTSTELLAEYHSSRPVRSTNLWAAYSFAAGTQTTDDSGNGRTLTAAGTIVTDTAGPNIV